MPSFPWDVFSANTLRPMLSDVFRSEGLAVPRMDKAETLTLLQNIEKHGREAFYALSGALC